MDIIDNTGDDMGLGAEFMQTFLVEVNDTIDVIEKGLIELESSPTNLDLINALFRAYHNVKGSSLSVGLRILSEVCHFAESALAKVRSGHLAVSEDMISLLLEAVTAMKEIAGHLAADGKEGDKRYFSTLARLEVLIQSSSATALNLEPGESKGGAAPEDGAKTQDEHEMIKVSTELINQLMLVVGDFMSVRSRFDWLRQKLPANEDFNDGCNQLDFVSSRLQSTMLKLRLSPVKPLFDSMHRVVRTTCGETKKKASFNHSGGETQIDRTILSLLREPLIHMMRNSIDHGFETPDERVNLNKPAEGLLNLRAFTRAGEVVVELSDDGRGIDPNRIKRKALEKGLISPEAAARMSEPDAQKLIFLPGFSSAEVVTNVSGRGVGMDVVKQAVESVGGIVELVSRVGLGSTFTLRLPMSLAIVDCLAFRVGEQVYAIAQSNIEEVFAVDSQLVGESLRRVHGGAEMLVIRNVPVPVMPMDEVLDTDLGPESRHHLVQVRYGKSRFALRVGPIIGPCSVVTQSLPPTFGATAPFSGVARAGDGSQLLQLDLSRLAAKVKDFEEPTDSHGSEGAFRSAGLSALNSSDIRRLQQKIILFKSARLFCIPVQRAKRIVYVESSQLQELGGKTYFTLEGHTIPLIWVEECLLKEARDARSSYSVCLFQLHDKQFGVLMSEFRGIVRMPAEYDDSLQTQGVLGSTNIDGETVLLLDIYALAKKGYEMDGGAVTTKSSTLNTVLIAEDDAFFRHQVCSFLANYDIKTVVAPDGLEAKKLLQDPAIAATIDAVVTDIEMPNLDGIALLRWIRAQAQFAEMPCIALTAITTKEMLKASITAGANAFVGKMNHGQVVHELRKLKSGVQNMDPTSLNAKLELAEERGTSQARIVTFQLGDRMFGLPMEVVREVSTPADSTRVAGFPDYIDRLAAFRGKSIPVIELSKLINLPSELHNERMGQLIVESGKTIFALVVGRVGEVMLRSALPTAEGMSRSKLTNDTLLELTQAVVKSGEELMVLLDVEKMCSLCREPQQQLGAASFGVEAA